MTACVREQSTPSTPAQQSAELTPELTPLVTATPTPTMTAIPPQPQTGRNRPLLLAHYMPWYQTPAVSGYWGWHWTMDHFNPNVVQDGRYQIASHYQPLIGPYDSQDAAVLEYHVLLMKLSGVDGVLVDWYGIEDFWDYGVIHASTERLFQAVQAADLRFAIVYEDQTVGHMVDQGRLDDEDALAHGQAVMLYLQEHWFQEAAYLKVDGRPVLLTFGPQFYKSAADWQALFSVLDKPPLLITLDNHGEAFADASYPWPPMWASTNGVLSSTSLENYLNTFYRKASRWPYLVAGAFPGFHDIYAEAGVGASYGFLDAREGETFAHTLQMALSHDPDVIQLITWNDFGEGTVIEPTVEFQYRYLEMIQEVQRSTINPDFPFTAEDLTLPLRLFELRQLYKGDAVVGETSFADRLDEVYRAVLAHDLEQARAILAELEALSLREPPPP